MGEALARLGRASAAPLDPPTESDQPIPAGRLRPHLLALAALAIVYTTVFAIGFRLSQQGLHWHSFDQVGYRLTSARIGEALHTEGVAAAARTAFAYAPPSGLLHVALGGLACALGVDPTFSVFVLFPFGLAIAFLAVRRASGSPGLAWTAVVLLTLPVSSHIPVGGATDFRADWLAQILWGTAGALALASHAGADRRLVLAAGLVLGITFVARSLSAAYALAGAPFLLLAAWIGTGRGSRAQRLGNLALGAAVAAAIGLPWFLGNRDAIWNYYVDNHISQRENEARGFTGGFLAHFEYYLRSLRGDHLGVLAPVAMVVLFGWLAMTLRGRAARGGALWLVGLAFLTPLAVLSLGPQYNHAVGGIVTWVVMLLPLVPALASRPSAAWPRWLAAGLIVLGLTAWPARFLRAQAREGEVRRAVGHHHFVEALEAILARTAGQERVVVSTLPLIDAINAPMLLLVEAERTGHVSNRFLGGLGHSIYRSDPPSRFEDQLRASDVVVWWRTGRTGQANVEADHEAFDNRAVVDRVLGESFTLAREWRVDGHPLELHFRKP